jgi:transcriptional regulator with XRE-family HTH domain
MTDLQDVQQYSTATAILDIAAILSERVADTESFYRLLGKRLEQARQIKGLSQAALGNRLRPPQTRASISNMEKGTQRVLAHTLVQLATALERSVADLLPSEEPTPAQDFEQTLAEKLSLSPKELKNLMAQIQSSK